MRATAANESPYFELTRMTMALASYQTRNELGKENYQENHSSRNPEQRNAKSVSSPALIAPPIQLKEAHNQ